MRLSEAIEQLQELAEEFQYQGQDPELRLTYQPGWPLQVTVTGIVSTLDVDEASGHPDEDFGDYEPDLGPDPDAPEVEPAVWLGGSGSSSYLNQVAKDALGWRQ